MNVGIKREKRLRSGHWKAIAGLLLMVSAITLVWAIAASISLWQRDRDLAKVEQALNDVREDLYRLQKAETEVLRVPDYLVDDYLSADGETAPPSNDLDLLEQIEQELGIITGGE